MKRSLVEPCIVRCLFTTMTLGGSLVLAAAAQEAQRSAPNATNSSQASALITQGQYNRQAELASQDAIRNVSAARKLLQLRRPNEARQMLSDVVRTNDSTHGKVTALRNLADIELSQKDDKAADSCYQRLFEIVLNPKTPPTDVSRCSHAAMDALYAYTGFIRQSGRDIRAVHELRSKLTQALERADTGRIRADSSLEVKLAGSHLTMARDLKLAGKKAESLAEFETLFSQYTNYHKLLSHGIDIRYEWIETHGYERNHPERIALMEMVFSDPTLQDDGHLANFGVHLGSSYENTKNPNTEQHYKKLVETIESQMKNPALSADDRMIFRDNYENALVGFATALKRRNDYESAARILSKIKTEFGSGEGGKFAKKAEADIKQSKRHGYSTIVITAVVGVVISLGIFLFVYLKPRMKPNL